jgi:hydrogenase maturation protease
LKDNRLFIYGFGNPGRQDDGMGPAIIDRLESDGIQGIVTDSNYQMNIEDAHNISQCDSVIFVDASIDAGEPFSFYKIEPSAEITFSTHTMSPESILALCKELYDKDMEAYVMAIRGYEWEFIEGFSDNAVYNFNEAYAFLQMKINELLKANTSPHRSGVAEVTI